MIGVILGIDGISSAIINIQYLHHFVHTVMLKVCVLQGHPRVELFSSLWKSDWNNKWQILG